MSNGKRIFFFVILRFENPISIKDVIFSKLVEYCIRIQFSSVEYTSRLLYTSRILYPNPVLEHADMSPGSLTRNILKSYQKKTPNTEAKLSVALLAIQKYRIKTA